MLVFNKKLTMDLYMDGLCDNAIAERVGVKARNICYWRKNNNLPNNKGIFTWQKKYKGEIPEKYRKPRVSK